MLQNGCYTLICIQIVLWCIHILVTSPSIIQESVIMLKERIGDPQNLTLNPTTTLSHHVIRLIGSNSNPENLTPRPQDYLLTLKWQHLPSNAEKLIPWLIKFSFTMVVIRSSANLFVLQLMHQEAYWSP